MFIKLQDLEVYQLARELSKAGWEIYNKLAWQDKKIIGDQFIKLVSFAREINGNKIEIYRN